MDLVPAILQVELGSCSSEVTLLIPIGSHQSIDTGDEEEAPYIEFPLVVEQGSFYVDLEDMSEWLSISMSRLTLDYVVYFTKVVTYMYSISSVGKFSWFKNPYVLYLIRRIFRTITIICYL